MTEHSGWRRREWLGTACTVALSGRIAAGSPWKSAPDAIEQIQTRARAARMQPFESSTTAHFHAIGDAPAQHRLDAIGLCESFATDYFTHFRAKGFQIDWPATKLPVVVLASPTSYAAFEQDFVDATVGGHFDLGNNWLVTFDFRSLGPRSRNPAAADPRLDNTLALVHEVFHQLSFNTGMLDRQADVPLCLVEGLATYAETWRPERRGQIGELNKRRRAELVLAQKSGSSWMPVRTLLANDAALNTEASQHLAYAESTMLVARLLKDSSRLPQLRDYIKAVQGANDPAGRVALATSHFGDLDQLDREIRR